MRIIQALCTVRYIGRCETFLEEAERLIIIKDDASVMIHVDSGIKPLNYMKSSKTIRFIEKNGKLILHAQNAKEELFVEMNRIDSDTYLPFPDSEREMVKSGTEDLLQEEIYERLGALIPGGREVCREFETGKGPVDVFGVTLDGSAALVVEVKRHAHRKDVYQVLKYGVGIDDLVADADAHGYNALEAKHKGDNDENGEMISVEAFRNRRLFLASRKFARGTIEEALEHGVTIIDMGDEANDAWAMEHKPDEIRSGDECGMFDGDDRSRSEIVGHVIGEQHGGATSGAVRHRRCVKHDDRDNAHSDSLFT